MHGAVSESNPERPDGLARPAPWTVPPRLYFMLPTEVGPLPHWPAALDRVADLGFDHVLIPSPYAMGAAGDALLAADTARLHPAFAFAGAVEEGMHRLVSCCRARGLRLLVDFVPDRVAADAGVAAAHPDWFSHSPADEMLPDPRLPPRSRHALHVRLGDAAVREAWEDWWGGRLAVLVEAGVAGFRCDGLAHTPPAFWRELIPALRGRTAEPLRFLAWTPGLPREGRAALVDCGFDATFSSACWWDFRAAWIVDEDEDLRRIAPPIAFPQHPYGSDPLSADAEPASCERRHRRALALASSVGHGWMVPMGFELGLRVTAHHGHPRAVAETSASVTTGQFDLSVLLRAANRRIAAMGALGPLQRLSGEEAPAALLFRAAEPAHDPAAAQGQLFAANPDVHGAVELPWQSVLSRIPGGLTALTEASGAGEAPSPGAGEPAGEAPLCVTGTALRLGPGEARLFHVRRAPLVLTVGADQRVKGLEKKNGEKRVELATRAPRVMIENVSPSVEGGRFAAKRIVGEAVSVTADLFMDGHERLAACVRWRAADEKAWHEVPMRALGNDRYAAEFVPSRIGRHVFMVLAWHDAFGSYRNEIEKKHGAGLDLSLELREGLALIERIAKAVDQPEAARTIEAIDGELERAGPAEQLQVLLSSEALARAAGCYRPFLSDSAVLPVEVERPAAGFAAWYELFPRSQSGDPRRHGSFDDVIARLPAIRELGFDVLYFPPIHPIGHTHRKGRNNRLQAEPGDPGSPYAIGSEEGGHDAIHPQLGTLADFQRLRAAAAEHGLELAIDFAIQCSPDHPWLKAHPEWFDWRPDGTIRYAENPPKKYEDIVNVDFYAAGSQPSLWVALRDVVLFWIEQGVRLFRVDNPHTKPFAFWEWMIAEVRGRAPDAIFLSEAFTRPKPMNRLAKLGFSQSYTYFTWRHTKAEFMEYMTQLTQGEEREYFRPHFFVNTPDINPYFLQHSGRAGFLIRAALASLLSGLWGMYNGFELCEGRPVPGKEEYLDSEKYEIRAWDWDRPGHIKAEIARLNRIRRDNPALHSHLGLAFHPAPNDAVLFFSKATPERDNVVLAAVSVDPHNVQETVLEVPLWTWKLPDDGALRVEDLLTGEERIWHGKWQSVRLDPHRPYAVWRVHPLHAPPAPGRFT